MASKYSGGDDVIATKCDVMTSKRSRKSRDHADNNDGQSAVTKRGNRSGDIVMRSKSPQYDDHHVISDDVITSPCSSGSFEGESSPASSDSSDSSSGCGQQAKGGAEDKVARDLIGQMIKDVVRRHLFSSDTNLSCDGGAEASPRDNDDDDEKMICNNQDQQPQPSTTNHHRHQTYESFRAAENNVTTNIETTDDIFSGNETIMMTSQTNDDDVFNQRNRRSEYGDDDDDYVVATVKDATTTSGKQTLTLSDDDLCEVTQLIQVPRLDLSQVIMLSGNNNAETSDEFAACSKDEAPKPKPRVLSCPQQIPQDNHKVKHHHRRRKKASSNHHHSVNDDHYDERSVTMESHLVKSAPIDIPQKSNKQQQNFDDNMLMDALSSSPSQGGSSPSRWRDAWSTDDEAPVVALSSGSINHAPAVMDTPDDMDMAPSSPTEHFEGYHRRHNHLRHHHHHHKRHPYHHGKTSRHGGNEDVSKHGDNNSSGESISNQEDEQTLRVDELSQNLERILKALCKNRDDAGRPEDITLMTRQQIRAEKMAMQKELLKFETDRGRPTAKWERDIMRDIYDRYRTVKRLLADTLSPTFPSQTLHHRRLVHHHTPATDECDFLVTREIATVEPVAALKTPTSHLAMAEKGKLQKEEGEEPVVVEGETPTCTQVQVSGDTNIMELRKQHQEAKHKKKKLRRRIRDFEREFKHQHQRAPTHVDMVVMATEYSEYREVRARLRLLEALIEKQHH